MTNMVTTAAAIMEAECRDKFSKCDTTTGKLEIAFLNAQDHWMFHEENDQFLGAIGAVMLNLGSDHEDFDKISQSIQAQRRSAALIHALQSGVSVDLEAMAEQAKDAPEIPFLLNRMWWDARDKKRGSSPNGE